MNHLDEISVKELQDALDNVDGNKPTQQLLVAIAYKNGVTQTELAEWHDTGRRTIYSWLKRLDTDESLEQAVTDDKRTGRKQKLSETQQEEFEEIVHEPPSKVGIDAPAWTPVLAQDFLENLRRRVFNPELSAVAERSGVELSETTPFNRRNRRRRARKVPRKDQKKRREMDATVVCIDQTKKSVQVEPRVAWFPRGTRPSVELSGQRDWTCLLGAINENSDHFFSRFTEYVTAEHAKHFILELCKEFKDNLIVVLDGAPYFQASAVTDLAARDDLAFVSLPSYSPELNPVEGAGDSCKHLLATVSLTRSTS